MVDQPWWFLLAEVHFRYTRIMQIFANLQDILENEIFYISIHSSGPGGQNVNKVATAVQLHFDVKNSPSLGVEVKERLMKLAGRRLTRDGELIIEAKRFRTRELNRSDAEQRLMVLLHQAATRPKRRRPTQPTLGSRVRRLEDKKKHARVKHLRKSGKDQDLA